MFFYQLISQYQQYSLKIIILSLVFGFLNINVEDNNFEQTVIVFTIIFLG